VGWEVQDPVAEGGVEAQATEFGDEFRRNNGVQVSIRGHRFKVCGEKFRGDVRGRFFTQRVVNVWKGLPREVVGAGMIVVFKEQLDKYMNRMGMEGYGLRKCIHFSYGRHHGRCRLGGPKGLFLCCNFLCSLFFEG